jgi:hypothetical protein
MAWHEPRNLDEYNRRYHGAFHVEGYGLEVTNHFPCPFCASPEWYVVRLMEFDRDSPVIPCERCGRSAQLQYDSDGQTSMMRVVQIDGPDLPEWLPLHARGEAR